MRDEQSQVCTFSPSKGHNSARGDNSDKKKYTVKLLFDEESIYEISKPYLEFFFLNGRTDARTDGRTDKPKLICSTLFQSWGHNEWKIMFDPSIATGRNWMSPFAQKASKLYCLGN